MLDLVRHMIFLFPMLFLIFNPFQSNFSATRILPSSYLFWAGKRLVGYLLLSYSFKGEKHKQKHNVGLHPT
jgi:hypothetical protein